MTDWTEFGLGDLPPLPARERVARMPPTLQALIDSWQELLARPLEGIRSAPDLRPGTTARSTTGCRARWC